MLVEQSVRGRHVSGGREAKGRSLLDLWLLIRKRRVLLVCFALGAAVLGYLFGVRRGNEYTATGEIELQLGSGSSLKSGRSRSKLASLDDVIETDATILQSPTLLVDIARNLKLLDNKDFVAPGSTVAGPNGIRLPLWHGNIDNPWVRHAVVSELKAGLTAQRVPRTVLISVSYHSRSAALAADVVDGVESTFIEDNFKSKYRAAEQVTKWLTSQIEDLRSTVQSSEDRVVDLQKKLGISAFDPEHTLVIAELANLQKNLSDATEARVLAEARYRILSSLPPSQIQDAPPSGGAKQDGNQFLLSSLRSDRAVAAASLAHLQPVYGPNYPQVRQLRSEIASLDQQIRDEEIRVVKEAQDAYRVARDAEEHARLTLDAKKQEIYGQRDKVVRYTLVKEDYESNRKTYESILTKLREAAVDSGLDSADIGLASLAALPTGPSSMSPLRLSSIGLVLGLCAGIGIAFLLDRMDTRLRDSNEIQSMLQLPALGVIPQGQWTRRQADLGKPAGPELLRDPRSPFSESFRALRTSMQLSSTSRQSRLITVTSCQPAEGKSTVAVNMAAVLAQGGKRVALVDTDMRRPSIYKRLHIEGGKGLSELLTGYYSLDQVTHRHETLTSLDVIPSGTVPPLPADLLASDQMAEVIQQLRERYDYVIFDTPPILSVTDPAIVAAQSDGMVLVIRQGICTRSMLARASEMLHNFDVKVYGFVFNGVDTSLPEYYGYLGYYTYEYGK